VSAKRGGTHMRLTFVFLPHSLHRGDMRQEIMEILIHVQVGVLKYGMPMRSNLLNDIWWLVRDMNQHVVIVSGQVEMIGATLSIRRR
jgi:hypothetical protein